MAYIPNSNSVVAFQSQPSSLLVGASIVGLTPVAPTPSSVWVLNPVSVLAVNLQSTNASVITVGGGTTGNSSVTAFQGGAWITSVVNTVPSSMIVGASIIGLTPVTVKTDVTVIQADPTQLTGTVSIAAIAFNNSSVVAVLKNSSVATLQGTNPWLIGNSSVNVIGTYLEKNAVTASVIGIPVLFKIDETNSVLSAVSPQSPFPVKGSVTVLQGTTPWLINMPSPSILIITPGGSVQAVRTDNASVITTPGTATWITSVVNTVPSSMMVGASIIGLTPVSATQITSPWVVNFPSPSIIAIQAGGSVLTILGTYQEKNAVTASVVGIPVLFKIDETNSVLSAVSPQSPFPVRGSVAVLQGTVPWQVTVAGSVMAASVTTLQGTNPWIVQAISSLLVIQTTSTNASVVGASVTTLQGTNPWQVNVPTPSYLSIQPGGSVMNVNVSGSVAVLGATASVMLLSTSASIAALVNNILTGNSSVQLISTSASIMANNKAIFGGNNTWTQNNSVIATGGLRNDTMSSITTADSTYSPFAVGPIGETVMANSPITKWVVGRGSVMSGTSIQVIAAPGTSIFSYITGVHLTNEASIATRVTLTQGLGAVAASMLTWYVVPAGGGSNAVYLNPIRVLDNLGISASISTVASVYVTITGFTAKT